MKSIINDVIGFKDEKLFTHSKKIKKYNKMKDFFQKPDTVYMADLLYMPHFNGYKYLLTITDIVSDKFDMQELKNKDSNSVLNGFLKIIDRDIIKQPKMLITDNGTEFKGTFKLYLEENDIIHKVSEPYSHRQTANIEALNKQLVRIFFAYMNKKELELNKPFNNWIEIVDKVRDLLNKHRKKDIEYTQPKDMEVIYKDIHKVGKPKFNLGDEVHYRLFYPKNALNQKQDTANFRTGDLYFSKEKSKIIKILIMQKPPYYRYILKDKPNIAYYEEELIK